MRTDLKNEKKLFKSIKIFRRQNPFQNEFCQNKPFSLINNQYSTVINNKKKTQLNFKTKQIELTKIK